MKKGLAYFIIPVLTLTSLLWTSTSLAQAPEPEIVVIHTAAEAQAESLALNVFFYLTDANGRPISKDSVNIEWADVKLLEGNEEPVGATVQDPRTPVHIALLLDTSGSMAVQVLNAGGSQARLIDEVREAAKSAIDSAPPNAVFSVIKFSELALDEELSIIENFTADHELVKRAIDTIDNPQGPTCLYNALYKSIELLEDQVKNPQERQAIILFTDGRDERGDGSIPCSERKYEDVIYRATRDPVFLVPIHTIGLCADENCSNINAPELRNMAAETRAFWAADEASNLSNMFQVIMDGLNSQWVAQASVFPRQGENQTVLRVKLREIETPLVTTFSFLSPKDYVPPPPPVRAEITSLTYAKEEDTYTVSLSLTSPQSVLRVIVEVWDKKTGTQVLPNQTFENPVATLKFERNTDGFEAGREYVFRVKAEDRREFLIEDEEGEVILAEAEFVHDPLLRPDVEFTITSVVVDSETGGFTIDLDVSNQERVVSYDGFVGDGDTKQKIYEFGPTLFTNSQIQGTLPDAIRPSQEARSYAFFLNLTTKEDESISADSYEVLVAPPRRPSFFARVVKGLTDNPVILIVIGVVILSVIGVVIIRSRPVGKQPLPPPRPPVVKTEVFEPASAPAEPRPLSLRLKVVRTPDPSQAVEKEITKLPCIIGRKPDCHVQINGDNQVSGHHAEIVASGDQCFIVDLGSTNGTFLGDKRLQSNVKTPLTGQTQVRLGHYTHLTIEPQA